MNEQLDLFVVKYDDRVENLRNFLEDYLLYHPCWHLSAKDSVELSNKFKVTGRKPLELYIEIIGERDE